MKRIIPFSILIFTILTLFTACDIEDLKEGYESQKQSGEIRSATEDFNLATLLNSGIDEVVTRARNIQFLNNSIYPDGVINIRFEPNTERLPGTECEITIIGEGVYTRDIQIRVSDFLNSEIIWTGTVPGDGRNGGETTFTLDAYYDTGNGYARFIYIEYLAGTIWHSKKIYMQEPLENLFETDIDLFIPADGGAYTISKRSTIPTNGDMAYFRAIIPNGTSIATAIMNSGTPTSPLTIPANNDEEREIRVQYSLDWGMTWTTFERWVQLGVSGSESVSIKMGKAYEQFSPSGGSGRMYLLAGEGTDLSQVEFRAVNNYHPTLSPDGTTPVIIEGLSATTMNVSAGGLSWDGYLDVTVEPSTGLNGWVHDIQSYIGFNYPHYVTAYTIQYHDKTQWRDIDIIEQRAYFILVKESTPVVKPNGGIWRLRMNGLTPVGQVMFKAALGNSHSNQVCDEPSNPVILNNFVTTAFPEININANTTGQSREIYLWYTIDGGITWHKCEEGDPLLKHWVFPEGYPVIQGTM